MTSLCVFIYIFTSHFYLSRCIVIRNAANIEKER